MAVSYRTIVILEEGDGGLEDGGFVHFARPRRHHRAEFIHEHVELITTFLFTQVTALPTQTIDITLYIVQ